MARATTSTARNGPFSTDFKSKPAYQKPVLFRLIAAACALCSSEWPGVIRPMRRRRCPALRKYGALSSTPTPGGNWGANSASRCCVVIKKAF